MYSIYFTYSETHFSLHRISGILHSMTNRHPACVNKQFQGATSPKNLKRKDKKANSFRLNSPKLKMYMSRWETLNKLPFAWEKIYQILIRLVFFYITEEVENTWLSSFSFLSLILYLYHNF